MVHSVAIVGSGLAGLVAGRRLIQHGFNVVIYDKSRGPGGRLANKRSEYGNFDFGAQYFTCSSPIFKEQVEDWIQRGIVKEWKFNPKVIDSPGEIKEKENSTIRYVGIPKMTEISRDIEKDINVKNITYSTLITKITKSEDSKFTLFSNDTQIQNTFDLVIINTPPEQAIPLLSESNSLQDICKNIKMSPCWALSLTFEKSLNLPVDGAFVNCSSISWISNISSKPERTQSPETWVIHSNCEWAKNNLEKQPDEVVNLLSEDFFTVLGIKKQNFIHSIAHRWRYSIALSPLEKEILFDDDKRIGVCGDWCNKGKVEGAYVSGYNLAQKIIEL